MGLVLCLGFGALLAFSCWAVGYCCNEAQKMDPTVRTYHALCEIVGGPRLATFVEVVMWLYLFGISLSFCIIIGDVSHPLAIGALGESSILGDRAILVAIICAALVFPLCLLRNISQLGASSGLAVLAVLYVVGCVVEYSFFHSGSGITLVSNADGSFVAMPVVGFGLGCHIQAPIILCNLEGPDRMASFTWVVVAAFSLCIAVYTVCGVAGYLTFGAETAQNILDISNSVGYPTSDIEFDVARVCVLL